MWQFMRGVHLRYLCHYVTECKGVFFDERNGHIHILKFKQFRSRVAEKMMLYNVYKYPHSPSTNYHNSPNLQLVSKELDMVAMSN